jgi:hypothetical protein
MAKSHPSDGVAQAIAPVAIRTKGRKQEKIPRGM